MNLGRVDNFNDSNYVIAFAPESKTTQEIMEKVASAPFMKGMFSSSSWRFPVCKTYAFILGFCIILIIIRIKMRQSGIIQMYVSEKILEMLDSTRA